MRNIISNITDESTKDFLEYLKYERRVSVNTVDSYGENLLLLKNYTNKDLISLKKEDIKDFLDNVEATARTKSNPCDGIKAPKLEKKLPTYLTNEEIAKLFNIRLTKPVDYRNKAILEVMYATGARISEVINLELNQIDFEECIIRVVGKGKKERIIPLDDVAIDALDNYINNYRPFLIKNETCNYVFLNKNGEKISRQMIFKMLKNLANKAGITKEISPHTLRHSFASNLLNNGADLRVIQELLGHENLETTEIYSHLQNKKIKDDYNNHPHAHF